MAHGPRISAAKVKIELAQLTKAPLPKLVIDQLAATEVTESGSLPMAEGIRDASKGNCVIINIGEGRSWLTSRIYVFASMLERLHGVRSIVFTSGNDGAYLGTSTPREISWRLGNWFPGYEVAFAAALGQVANGDRGGLFHRELNNAVIDQLLDAYLHDAGISRHGDRMPEGWLSPGSSFENAQWVTPSLPSAVLADGMDRGYFQHKDGRSEIETARLVLEQSGSFVAVVGERQRFRDLIDRLKITDQVGSDVARQLADEDGRRPRRRT